MDPSATSPTSGSPALPGDQGYSIFPETVPPYIGAVMFESFLYGVYSILFVICVYVLLQRKQRLHWILFASAVVMFSLASADIGYTYYLVFGKLLVSGLEFSDIRPKYWLYVTNNVIADSLLLYRCYVVWGRKKAVIAGPIILLVAVTVCGYVFEGTVPKLFQYAWIYLTMTFILNTILMLLTAGRIWWLAHKAHVIIGESLLQRYNASITILIESGFLYSLYIILDLAFQKHKVGSIILDAGLVQIVGIMPTLIIVQVGLGRAVQELDSGSAIDDVVVLSRMEGQGTKSFGGGSGYASVRERGTYGEEDDRYTTYTAYTSPSNRYAVSSPSVHSSRSVRSTRRRQSSKPGMTTGSPPTYVAPGHNHCSSNETFVSYSQQSNIPSSPSAQQTQYFPARPHNPYPYQSRSPPTRSEPLPAPPGSSPTSPVFVTIPSPILSRPRSREYHHAHHHHHHPPHCHCASHETVVGQLDSPV